jgi:AdoMet-dependent heme synthase
MTGSAFTPAATALRIDAPGSDFHRVPVTVAWETTRACHLKCLHCRAEAQPRRHPQELTTDEGMSVIAQAAEMGVRVFVITGGDPLMRPDVFGLIGAVSATGMHCGFSPSATRKLSFEALEQAVDAGAGTVHLSLDGASAQSHDRFRGVPGSFERTLAALDAARSIGARVQVGTTVSTRTADELEQMVPLLADRIDLWSLFFLVPTGRGQVAEVLTAEGHESVLRWLAESEFPFAVRTVAAPTHRRVLSELGHPVAPGVNDGNGFAFVSHVGDVCPSGFLPLPAGNVRRTPLAEIYRESPLFRALRDPALLSGRCGRCRYRIVCGGSRARAWAMTGDPLASDPTCAYRPADAER